MDLRPEGAARPRLAAGLPLLRSTVRGCYLSGGDPDLLLPSSAEPRPAVVSFDGSEQRQPPLMAAGFPIPLRKLPGIERGEHEVVADGERLAFTVLHGTPGGGDRLGTGTLVWEGDNLVEEQPGTGSMCGAIVAEQNEPTEPLLVRRGQEESWWLQQEGTGLRVPEPAVPALLDELGLTALYFEAVPPRTAVWLVQRRGSRWKVRRIRGRAPEFTRLEAESRSLWSRLAGHGPPNEPLWSLYEQAWCRARDW